MGQKNSLAKPELSTEGSTEPFNFQHHISIEYDPNTGKLIGLPEEWAD
jgi:hypothetical protein